MMVRPSDKLWKIVRAAPAIDAKSLARAVEEAASDADDFRTKLLIRDSVRAIGAHWGERALQSWIAQSPSGKIIREICDAVSRDANDEEGFPSLKRRIVDAINPDDVLELLRALSPTITRPTRLIIGGSIALIMNGYLQRHTEDIDVVDEVPADVRTQFELLAELEKRYGLHIGHFQSHYLPAGWEQRIHSLIVYGELQVFVVDAYDVFLTKVFSNRSKDQDDLRAVLLHLDRTTLRERFKTTTAALRQEEKLCQAAEHNWFVLFGEPLPN